MPANRDLYCSRRSRKYTSKAGKHTLHSPLPVSRQTSLFVPSTSFALPPLPPSPYAPPHPSPHSSQPSPPPSPPLLTKFILHPLQPLHPSLSFSANSPQTQRTRHVHTTAHNQLRNTLLTLPHRDRTSRPYNFRTHSGSGKGGAERGKGGGWCG